MFPFWAVEAAVVAAASAGLNAVAGVAPEVAAVVVEVADVVVAAGVAVVPAPPNKLGVAADVAGAALDGVDPKRDFAAVGAVVAVDEGAEEAGAPPNKPLGLLVAAPPNRVEAAELPEAGAAVVDAASLGLAPNSEPAAPDAGAGWEAGVAPPPKRPDDGAAVSGFFPNGLLPVSLAAPPKRETADDCGFAAVEVVLPNGEAPVVLGAAGWLAWVLPVCFEA